MGNPMKSHWKRYLKTNVQSEPDIYAVYQLANDNDILYIGEGHLKSRLLAHFPDGKESVVGAKFYRYELTGSKERSIERQNALLKKFRDLHIGNNPPFNAKSKN